MTLSTGEDRNATDRWMDCFCFCAEMVWSFFAGTLGWQDLVDRELPQYALVDLARAIYLLFGQLEFKDGTKNLLLAILEELIGEPPQSFKKHLHIKHMWASCDVRRRICTELIHFLSAVVPQPWHVENIARLLVLCGNSVCYGILASKAINRRLQETTKIIVYIILVREMSSCGRVCAAKSHFSASSLFLPLVSSAGLWEGQLPHVLGGEVGGADLHGVQHRYWKALLHSAAGEHVLSGDQGGVWTLCSRWEGFWWCPFFPLLTNIAASY